MDKKNFKSFNEFWEEIKPKKVELDNRPKEQLMAEILEIESKKKGEN